MDNFKIGRIRFALLRTCARVLLAKWQREIIADALKEEAFQDRMAAFGPPPTADLLDRIASAFHNDDHA